MNSDELRDLIKAKKVELRTLPFDATKEEKKTLNAEILALQNELKAK